MKLGRQLPNRLANPVPAPRPVPATPLALINVPKAAPLGTQLALVGIMATGIFLQGDTPTQIGRFAAIGVGLSLMISLALDLRRGVQNVIRADVMAILAFYFLTLFELLFPQTEFDVMTNARATHMAVIIVLVGMAGLLVGRHIPRPKKQPFAETLTREVPAAWIIMIFFTALFIGFAYMLASVDFNVLVMLDWFMAPRFSQPWGRGKFGDWRALLFELNMLTFLIPPLGGVILARRDRYAITALVGVSAGLALTFFYSFSSGTRNLFASHLVTFLIGYAFSLPANRRKEIVPLCIGGAVLFMAASTAMLKFRTGGLKNWIATGEGSAAPMEKTVFVDYNLCAISRLVDVFPSHHAFLGWEVPFQAFIRPIPRAIWKGKPEGLSMSIEQALGAENMTIAASFAGESYIAGGMIGVIIGGLFFGIATGWWSYLSSSRNSELGVLIYASGFFAAVISMRSLFSFTTALLPTITAIVIGSYAVKTLIAQTRRLLNRRPALQRPPSPPNR